MITCHVMSCYILFVICTHTYTHIQREGIVLRSKLRCGFVPLMNLQRDSTESPFTYMYVINTTYYLLLLLFSESLTCLLRLSRPTSATSVSWSLSKVSPSATWRKCQRPCPSFPQEEWELVPTIQKEERGPNHRCGRWDRRRGWTRKRWVVQSKVLWLTWRNGSSWRYSLSLLPTTSLKRRRGISWTKWWVTNVLTPSQEMMLSRRGHDIRDYDIRTTILNCMSTTGKRWGKFTIMTFLALWFSNIWERWGKHRDITFSRARVSMTFVIRMTV